jgi:hypothetical protein
VLPENSELPEEGRPLYLVGQEEIDAIAAVIRKGALFRYASAWNATASSSATRSISAPSTSR